MWGEIGGTIPPKKSEKNINTWANILLAGPLTSIILGVLLLTINIILLNNDFI